MVDIVISFIAAIITFPAMALTAAAIWLESGGPVLFTQQRVGLHGTEFEMLKFRSMYQNSEQHGPSWTRDGDRRIKRVGKFIRKTRLDKLPQIINGMRWHMSVV